VPLPKKTILDPLYARRYCRLINDQKDGSLVLQRPLVFRKPVSRFGTLLKRSEPVVSIRIYTGVTHDSIVTPFSMVGLYSHTHKFFLGTFARICNTDHLYHKMFYIAELALSEFLRMGHYNWLLTDQITHCNCKMLLRVARKSTYVTKYGELLPPNRRLRKGDYFFGCQKAPNCMEYKTVKQISTLVNERDYYIMPPSLPTVEPVVRLVEEFEEGKFYLYVDRDTSRASVVKIKEIVGYETASVGCVCLNSSFEYVKIKDADITVPLDDLFPIKYEDMSRLYPNYARIQEEAKLMFRHLPKIVRQRLDLVFDSEGEPDWVSTLAQTSIVNMGDAPDPTMDDEVEVGEPISIAKATEVATGARPRLAPETGEPEDVESGDDEEEEEDGDTEEAISSVIADHVAKMSQASDKVVEIKPSKKPKTKPVTLKVK